SLRGGGLSGVSRASLQSGCWSAACGARYYLQRWPSQRSMKRGRAKIKAKAARGRAGHDIREVIVDLNPILRGCGNDFRTGNASEKLVQIDRYVDRRLGGLMRKRCGRHIAPASGRPRYASGSRRTACTACAAPSATRRWRRDHQDDHR
ncbi:MAG: group II intron maturase-specific domain-containing protein, partial [Solirubrobacteraceae bacterium]